MNISTQTKITAAYPIGAHLPSNSVNRVYSSRHPKTDEEVVVKLIAPPRSGHSVAVDRFYKDLGAIQFLELPNIPRVLHFGFDSDHQAFMVMESTDRFDLANLAGFPPTRTAPLLIQVLDTLETLAMADIPHLNLHPNNILIANGPGGETAKIIGFGTPILHFAHCINRHTAPELQRSTATPERNSQSDAYSIALIAARILGAQIEQLDSNHPQIAFSGPVRETVPGAADLEIELSKALQLDPSARPPLPVLKHVIQQSIPLLTEETAQARTQAFHTADRSHTKDSTRALPPREAGPKPQSEEPARPAPPSLAQSRPRNTEIQPPTTAPSKLPLAKESGLDTGEEPELREEEPPRISPTAHKQSQLMVALGTSVILVLLVGVVLSSMYWLRSRKASAAQPTRVLAPTPIPTPIRTTPEMPIHRALTEANQFVLDGDIGRAHETLTRITAVERAAFSDEEDRIFADLTSTVLDSRIQSARSMIESGFASGNLNKLEKGIDSMDTIGRSAYSSRSEIQPLLSRARNVIDLDNRLLNASRSGDHPAILQQAQRLAAALPSSKKAFELRAASAAALEAESRTLMADGRYQEARAKLKPIATFWPDRMGLDKAFATIDQRQQMHAAQLARIEDALAEEQPDMGLKALNQITPIAPLRQRHGDAVTTLRTRLAALDGQAPSIEFKNRDDIQFRKRRPVVLVFDINDDYRLISTRAMIRTDGTSDFSEIPLQRRSSSRDFALVISPEDHHNESFSLYLEATDVSGHIARLGSAEQPLEIDRKRGLKALFGRN